MKKPELSGYSVDTYTEARFWYVYYQLTFNLVTREGFVSSRSAFLRDVELTKGRSLRSLHHDFPNCYPEVMESFDTVDTSPA